MTRQRFDSSRQARLEAIWAWLGLTILGLMAGSVGLLTIGCALFQWGGSAEVLFFASWPLLIAWFLLSRAWPTWLDVRRLSRTYVALDSFGMEVVENGDSRLFTWDEIDEVRVTSAWVILKLREGEDYYLPLHYQRMDELVAALRGQVTPSMK